MQRVLAKKILKLEKQHPCKVRFCLYLLPSCHPAAQLLPGFLSLSKMFLICFSSLTRVTHPGVGRMPVVHIYPGPASHFFRSPRATISAGTTCPPVHCSWLHRTWPLPGWSTQLNVLGLSTWSHFNYEGALAKHLLPACFFFFFHLYAPMNLKGNENQMFLILSHLSESCLGEGVWEPATIF